MFQAKRKRMRVFDWMRDHLLATVVCYLVVVAVTAVSAVGIGVWFLAALVTGGSTGALLNGVLAVLLATLLGGTVAAFLSLVGIGFGLYARAASTVAWLDDALARWTGVLTGYGAAFRSAAADAVEPTASHPGATDATTGLDRLKAKYVQGSLSDHEFERRVRDLLGRSGGADHDPAPATDGHVGEANDWLDRIRTDGDT
jgi:hypothetical protein